ncbi:MAG: hypothetical protein V2G43_02155 [bacterium JZ-2024 1]
MFYFYGDPLIRAIVGLGYYLNKPDEVYLPFGRLSISPDGRLIVLDLTVDRKMLVSVSLDPDQRNRIDILYQERGRYHNLGGATFSPNGKHIVFHNVPQDLLEKEYGGAKIRLTTDLFIYDVEKKSLTQLTHTPESDEYGAAFSPDGSEVFFFRAWKASRQKFHFAYNIFRKSLIDGTEQPILPNAFEHLDPGSAISVSPDGKMLIFSAGERRRPYDELYLIDLKGPPEIRQITKGGKTVSHFTPSFSPDGTVIVCIKGEVDMSKFPAEGSSVEEVWLMNLDGAYLRQVTSSGFRKRSPVFSPDGKKIYFLGESEEMMKEELWVVDTDGKNPHRITKFEFLRSSDETG